MFLKYNITKMKNELYAFNAKASRLTRMNLHNRPLEERGGCAHNEIFGVAFTF